MRSVQASQDSSHGCGKDPRFQGVKSVAAHSAFDHPTLVRSGCCAAPCASVFSFLGAAGSGAAPGDEQPACLAAGSSVQHLGMLPALRAQLLSNKCAPHRGTNVTPEISQVKPLRDPFRGIAMSLCPGILLSFSALVPYSSEQGRC